MCVSVTQLSQQVDEDEEVGDEEATAPGGVDVLALLTPLEPHPDAVLEEGADQAEAGHVGEVVFGHPQELKQRGDQHTVSRFINVAQTAFLYMRGLKLLLLVK